MKRNVFLSITVCILLASSRAGGEDLQDHLNSTYIHKIYILRHPIAKETQHYDSAGQLLDSASEGPWTVYGALEIKNALLSANRLRLNADRLIYNYDQEKKDLVPKRVKWGKAKVTVDVTLSHPVASVEEADDILHRIFVFSESELVETAPEYWRPYLKKQASASTAPAAGSLTEIKKDTTQELEKINPPAVTAPKPVYTPEPEFTQVARDFKKHGTMVMEIIVDKTGVVMQPEIIRPIGFGLDEQAVIAVRGWKFKPAMREGKPVAVMMAIEIAFDLF